MHQLFLTTELSFKSFLDSFCNFYPTQPKQGLNVGDLMLKVEKGFGIRYLCMDLGPGYVIYTLPLLGHVFLISLNSVSMHIKMVKLSTQLARLLTKTTCTVANM